MVDNILLPMSRKSQDMVLTLVGMPTDKSAKLTTENSFWRRHMWHFQSACIV
jgi:hypothetical protein